MAFGDKVVVCSFTNLYGCRIGSRTRVGTFVEIQRGAEIRSDCKIESHSFVCEGVSIGDEVFIGHGVVFINDKLPRATTADGGLKGGEDWELLTTIVERGASVGSAAVIRRSADRRGGDGRGRLGRHPRRGGRGDGRRKSGSRDRSRFLRASMAGTANEIPFAGLDRQHAAIEEDLRRTLDRVIGRSAFILGEEVSAFEAEFADCVGVRHCVGGSSGTAAGWVQRRVHRYAAYDLVSPRSTSARSMAGPLRHQWQRLRHRYQDSFPPIHNASSFARWTSESLATKA